jgi:hypothetical protein
MKQGVELRFSVVFIYFRMLAGIIHFPTYYAYNFVISNCKITENDVLAGLIIKLYEDATQYLSSMACSPRFLIFRSSLLMSLFTCVWKANS